MHVFQWAKEFETGIVTVDQQHQHLVEVTNAFGELLTQDKVDFDQLENVFSELVSYTQYHFDTEEELMNQSGIDAHHADYHQREHRNFLQEISILHEEVASGRNSARNLFDFLMNWLVYHILGTDRNMGQQLAAIDSGSLPHDAYLSCEHHVDLATGLLLKSLDQLFSQVVQRNKQLRELNLTLESKVTERTRELSEANRLLEKQALTDALTGLANRRQAMQLLEAHWKEAEAADLPLSCMLIDADGFKEINDCYGHDAGDAVLCGLAKQLQHAVRTDDFVCRLGGDEFLIICPQTDPAGALHLATQLHEMVANQIIPAGAGAWHGSISVGVASKNSATQQLEDLIKAADLAVYAAKAAGKNCVKTA